MAGQEVYFTRAGLAILEQRLIEHDARTQELLRALGEANKRDPDLPENAESKELRAKLHNEIPAERAKLLALKASSILVEQTAEYGSLPEDTVGVGCEVTIENSDESLVERVETWQIRGALESNPDQGILSYEAPLARAMIGKRVGEFFSRNNGRTEFRILSSQKILDIETQPDAEAPGG